MASPHLKQSYRSHGEGSVKDRMFDEREKLLWEATTPETLKQIMQIIHCNVKPRYQQSRLSLRHQIFPPLIQEGLCQVLEVEPFRAILPEHPLTEFTLGKITCYFFTSSCV